jgi:hypothetical protein
MNERLSQKLYNNLSTEDDLSMYAKPIISIKFVLMSSNWGFVFPYHDPVYPQAPFLQLFLMLAEQLIHNEILHYDNHEWIAKVSVLSFEEQPIKYMQTVRHYLLYIFIGDFYFRLQRLFKISMDNITW